MMQKHQLLEQTRAVMLATWSCSIASVAVVNGVYVDGGIRIAALGPPPLGLYHCETLSVPYS